MRLRRRLDARLAPNSWYTGSSNQHPGLHGGWLVQLQLQKKVSVHVKYFCIYMHGAKCSTGIWGVACDQPAYREVVLSRRSYLKCENCRHHSASPGISSIQANSMLRVLHSQAPVQRRSLIIGQEQVNYTTGPTGLTAGVTDCVSVTGSVYPPFNTACAPKSQHLVATHPPTDPHPLL